MWEEEKMLMRDERMNVMTVKAKNLGWDTDGGGKSLRWIHRKGVDYIEDAEGETYANSKWTKEPFDYTETRKEDAGKAWRT